MYAVGRSSRASGYLQLLPSTCVVCIAGWYVDGGSSRRWLLSRRHCKICFAVKTVVVVVRPQGRRHRIRLQYIRCYVLLLLLYSGVAVVPRTKEETSGSRISSRRVAAVSPTSCTTYSYRQYIVPNSDNNNSIAAASCY